MSHLAASPTSSKPFHHILKSLRSGIRQGTAWLLVWVLAAGNAAGDLAWARLAEGVRSSNSVTNGLGATPGETFSMSP
jgi:hypothetical protein